MTFSTDGPSAVPNGPADLLLPGAVPAPVILVPGGPAVEVNAFSYGRFGPIDATTAFFSVAPGSLSLPGFGAGPEGILVVGGGGALGVFAAGASIGLAPGDNLDAPDFAVIPEPTTVSLLLIGMAGLAALRRRMQ